MLNQKPYIIAHEEHPTVNSEVFTKDSIPVLL